ncbi:MAG: MFS transporter [Chloroflexia bacterium]
MPANNTYETQEAEVGAAAPPPLTVPAAAQASLRFQIGLSFFAFILIGSNDAALGILLPSMQGFYGIDKATISIMFIASVSGYLISAFSSGLLVERLGLRNYMLLGTLVFGFGVSMLALAVPFPVIVAISVLTGFGVAILDAGLNSYIAGLPNSTAALNYLHAFYGLGALLGPLVATGILQVGLAWNVVYYIWVVICVILFVGFFLIFKDGRAEQPARQPGEGNVMRDMLHLPVVWIGALFLLVYVGLEVSLGAWGYSFLTEERRDAADFSGVAISGYWLGLTVGRLAMGKIGSKLGSKVLISLCLAGTIAGCLIMWLIPFPASEAAGLWLVGFSLGPIFPTTISLMSDAVPARLLPSVIGFMAGLGAMGAAVFPASVGALAQGIGLWSLLPFEIALAFVLVLIWLRFQAMTQGANTRGQGSVATA